MLMTAIQCKQTAEKMAKWGYDSDWGTNHKAYDAGDGRLKIIGRDIKFKNGFGGEKYVVYTGIGDENHCTIISIDE
jgi:hypothetical protein